jgi:hypothetical protein
MRALSFPYSCIRVTIRFNPLMLMSHPVHLILSPGTRIVTRNDANRIGGGQLILAGAVAVITDSPADAQHAYKVRFNDGAEAMPRRNEFSILKEFKGIDGDERAAGILPAESSEVPAGCWRHATPAISRAVPCSRPCRRLAR